MTLSLGSDLRSSNQPSGTWAEADPPRPSFQDRPTDNPPADMLSASVLFGGMRKSSYIGHKQTSFAFLPVSPLGLR